jgi:hypothetical protein
MKKPAFKVGDNALIQGLRQQLLEISKALQVRHGFTIEEAREQALHIILGGRDTTAVTKMPRADTDLRKAGVVWKPLAEAAAGFGISRRTLERWARYGCALPLNSGHVSFIKLKTRPAHRHGRPGKLVSLEQVQKLLYVRAKVAGPGRKLPAVRGEIVSVPPITPQLASNMWRCSRAITLLRGVTDADMLDRTQMQVGLLIRKRKAPVAS